MLSMNTIMRGVAGFLTNARWNASTGVGANRFRSVSSWAEEIGFSPVLAFCSFDEKASSKGVEGTVFWFEWGFVTLSLGINGNCESVLKSCYDEGQPTSSRLNDTTATIYFTPHTTASTRRPLHATTHILAPPRMYTHSTHNDTE